MDTLVSKLWKLGLGIGIVATVVACGGGGEGGDGPTDDTNREITNEQLAQMVLALEQLGPEYAGFAPEAGSGALNLDQAAEEEDDPVAEREDLGRFGWAATHKAIYEHPQPGDGRAASLGSMVYLFNKPEGADGYLSDSVDEIEAAWSEEGVEEIDVSEQDLADKSFRLRIKGTIDRDDGSSAQLSAVAVAFRHGRLLGIVTAFTIGAADEESQRLEGTADALAPVMNERIKSVLAAAPAVAGQ